MNIYFNPVTYNGIIVRVYHYRPSPAQVYISLPPVSHLVFENKIEEVKKNELGELID